ncbi:type VI secretion system-associated FHA domain protein [Leisingera aquaemixtae]
MISAGGNNPLKFSITPEQAVEAMVRPGDQGLSQPGNSRRGGAERHQGA